MQTRWLAGLAILTLSGCASVVPQFDIPSDAGGPTVDSIRREIRCELGRIANGSEFDRFTSRAHDVVVAIQLSLDVTDDGGLAPKLTPSPLWVGGPAAVNAGFNLEQSREQNFQAQLLYSMAEMKLRTQGQLDPATPGSPCGHPPDTNLSGDLGLEQAWRLGQSALTDVDWSSKGAVGGAFGGIVTFTVKKQLTASGPVWAFAQYSGPGGFLSASEVNLDKLTFAFLPGPKAKKDKGLARKAALEFLGTVIQGGQSNSLTSIQGAR